MKGNIIIFFLFISFLSCQNNRPPEIPTDPDVQEIITVCLATTFENIDSARFYLKLMAPVLGDTEYSASAKKYNDSIARLLDTAKIYLVVKDTLGLTGAGSGEDIEAFAKLYIGSYLPKKSGIDHDPFAASPQKLDLKRLAKDLHIPIRSGEENINDELRLIGQCRFSNVLFDHAKNKAVVLLDFMSGHIGHGEMFYLWKEEGMWKVLKRQKTWVS